MVSNENPSSIILFDSIPLFIKYLAAADDSEIGNPFVSNGLGL